MSRYKKALESIIANAYEFTNTQGEDGYYLRAKVTNDKDVKLIRKIVAKLQRQGRM